jgi:hypothetical protein
MSQWLRTLSSDSKAADDALNIRRFQYNERDASIEIEVSISYDLLQERILRLRNGYLSAIENGHNITVLCARATNGNCLLVADAMGLVQGTNQIRAGLTLFGLNDLDRPPLIAVGPVFQYVMYDSVDKTIDRASHMPAP